MSQVYDRSNGDCVYINNVKYCMYQTRSEEEFLVPMEGRKDTLYYILRKTPFKVTVMEVTNPNVKESIIHDYCESLDEVLITENYIG